MADQKRWFKVWTSILSDDDFDPSRPEGLRGLGRMAMLGAYTALHGKSGRAEILPATLFRLLAAHGVPDLTTDLALKNVSFEEGKNRYGKITVTWRKWRQYQEDSTTRERMQLLRSKKRGEEKRGEEKREEQAAPPGGGASPGSLTTHATEVLGFLNEKAGTRFRARLADGRPTASLKLIIARLRSGVTPEQCRGVIAKKVREWKGDPKTQVWLRPDTLFGASKFESYLGQ